MGLFRKKEFIIEQRVLKRYLGKSKKVVIPDSVASIGKNAFEDTDIEEVVIPDSVIVIENYAFRGCLSLKKVTMGDHVERIEEGAFWGCRALKTVFIPDSVFRIGSYAFEDCVNAEIVCSISISDFEIKSGAFLNCRKVTRVPSVWKYIRRLEVEGKIDDTDTTPAPATIVAPADTSVPSDTAPARKPRGSGIFGRKKKKGKYVFISYGKDDQTMADAIREILNGEEIATWMESQDITDGSDYESSVSDAIKGSSCMLLLFTEGAKLSHRVFNEIKLAFNVGKPIVVMKMDDCSMNYELRYYLGNQETVTVEMIDKSHPTVQKLIKTVKHHLAH